MTAFAEQVRAEQLIDFTQRLVRTPSLSGQEAPIAQLIAREMEMLGYDQVRIDEVGNVVGRVKGTMAGPTLIFNAHMDHVPPGLMSNPYDASLIDGARFGHDGQVLYGRASMDMKGPLAATVYGAGAAARSGRHFKGEVIVTAVVKEEEARGEGILHLLRSGLTGDFAVSAEATRLQTYLGHRGKLEYLCTTRGRTSHGSTPAQGINAIFKMMDFIARLRAAYALPQHELLQEATWTVIDIAARPGRSTPIVPDQCEIVLDRRYMPDESAESVAAELRAVADELSAADPDFKMTIENIKDFPVMFTKPNEPIVGMVRAARAAALGEAGALGAWRFGVDGTHINRAGIPCVGFGPGDERWAHTPDEHLPVDELVSAARVYATLVERLDTAGASS